MNRQVKLKINTVFFIFLLSAVYFFINRFITIPPKELMGIKWNFSQIPTLLFALLQWIVLVNYIHYFVPKKAIVQLNVGVFMVLFLDCMIIIINKTNQPTPFLQHLFFVSHTLVKFFASGLIAVIASVYLRVTVNPNNTYIPEKDYSIINAIENYQPISARWKNSFLFLFYSFSFVSLILLVLGTYYALYRNNYTHWLYKCSGVSFLLAISSIGFQLRWNLIRFQRINSSRIFGLYVTSFVFAIWGILFDFFTGFLFFVAGFFTLIATHSGKDDSPVKGLLVILNVILATLTLIFHFMFSLGK